MDPKQMGKQMVEFNKAMFNNYFSAICVLQDQTEKALGQMMAQSPLFPPEVKSAVAKWFDTYKQGRDNFKTFADDHFKKMEELCSGKK